MGLMGVARQLFGRRRRSSTALNKKRVLNRYHYRYSISCRRRCVFKTSTRWTRHLVPSPHRRLRSIRRDYRNVLLTSHYIVGRT